MKELLKKKITKIGIAVIILAVAIGIISINVRSAQRQWEYDGHIDAAEKYLTELDYEQAIAEYMLALEIEPNNEEVLNALEQTYLDYAQSLADAGNYEKAVSVLEEGYAQTGRESMQTKVEELLLCLRNHVDDCWSIHGGVFSHSMEWVGSEQYISDAQIKEVCAPVINYLEQYSAFYELADWQREDLAQFYYMTGEFELCKEICKEIGYGTYGIAGHRSKGECEESGEIGNGETYRVYYYYDGLHEIFEYGENGKIIKMKCINDHWEDTIERVFEYDAEGRISKKTILEHDSKEDLERLKVFTYAYSEKGFTEHFAYEDSHGHITGWSRDYEIISENGEVQGGESYDGY